MRSALVSSFRHPLRLWMPLFFSLALLSPRAAIHAQNLPNASDLQPRSRSSAAAQIMSISQLPRFQAPRIDAQERRGFYRSTDPDRISEPSAAQLSPRSSGVWETLADGSRMWRLRVSAPGSLTIALVFHDFHLPQHGQMFVYAITGEGVRERPYTSASNPRDGVFATGPLPSDEAIVEIDLPAAEESEMHMILTQVNRGFIQLAALVGNAALVASSQPGQYAEVDTSQQCEVNVACPQGQGKFKDNTRSVGLIVTPEGRLCSGSFLNSVPSNFAPYFLTAFHCGPVSGWTVITAFESQTCTVGGASSMANQITNWVEVASNIVSDFMLIQTLEPIPPSYNLYFNGWFAQNLIPESGAAVLHHPAGNVQKISASFEPLVDSGFLGIIEFTDWRIDQYDLGITEPGSSGGPLINTNLQVIGQVHGGFSSCSPPSGPDYFGKFSLSFNAPDSNEFEKLAPYIDPQGIASAGNLTGYGGYPPGSLLSQVSTAINVLLQTSGLPQRAQALLQDASNQVKSATDPQFWNGPAYLYSLSGALAFTEAATAAQDLETLLSDYSSRFPAGSLKPLLSIANSTASNPLYNYQPASLISSVRAIVTVAELNAPAGKLSQINALVANGDMSANTGDPVKAITQYGLAWQLAAGPANGLLLITLASPPNGGTVVPGPSSYASGTQVNVVANANPGWMLGSWSGPVGPGTIGNYNQLECPLGTCPPAVAPFNVGTVTMNSPTLVTAHFIPAPAISIKVSQKTGPSDDRTWSIVFTNNSTSTISQLLLNPITWSTASAACTPVAQFKAPILLTASLGPGQSATFDAQFDFSSCPTGGYEALIPASFVLNNQTVAIETRDSQ